jgi:hypothetical protein
MVIANRLSAPYAFTVLLLMAPVKPHPEQGAFHRVQDARGLCQVFFSWYNTARRHSGVGLMTPAMVHRGEVEAVTQVRELTLSAAFERHPERFVQGKPRPPVVPEAAWINKPKTNSSRSEACALTEKTLIPRVQGDGSMQDRRSCGIPEADSLDPAPRPPGNDTRLVIAQGHRPREGWEEAFRAAGPSVNDELLLDTLPPNQFDQEEWRW